MRIIPLFLTFVLLVCLTGCWDRREINDIAFVFATAVDREDGQIRISTQFPLVGQMGTTGSSGGGGGTSGGKKWQIQSAVGRNIREADANDQKALSRQLNFSHRRVILFGEEISRNGLGDMMDILGRVPQNRLSSHMIVTEGPAYKVLSTDSPSEIMPAEKIREVAAQSLRHPVTIEQFVNDLLMGGVDPYTPYFGLQKSFFGKLSGEEELIAVKGIALFTLFKNDKLAETLEGRRAEGLLIALNQSPHPIITVEAPDGSGVISLRFPRYKANVKADLNRGSRTPVFAVHVTGSIALSDNASHYRISESPATIRAFEKAVEDHLTSEIRAGIEAAQAAGVDPVGFGLHLQRFHPDDWETVASQWHEICKRADVSVTAQLRFAYPGELTHPLGISAQEVSS